MHRFKITEMGNKVFWLHDQERDHLVRVLRLGVGTGIVGYDNSGAEYRAEVAEIGDHSVTCRILETDYPGVEAASRVFLAAGLSKGEKMEWVIQKGTELGIAGLIPLRTQRAVMRLDGDKAGGRVERWQKIAAEAAKQSHRVQEPLIYPVSDWTDLVHRVPEGTQWIVPYELEAEQGMRQVLDTLDPGRPVALLIGPEGGFEPAEVAWAQKELKALSVSLGPRILRAETAALVALTLTLGHWGDLGG